MPASLHKSNFWWSGPAWLNLNQEDWPRFPHTIAKKDIPEFKSTAISAIVTEQPFFDIIKRYGKLMRLLRVVAYIFQFYNRLKQKTKGSGNSQPIYDIAQPILPNEIEHATLVLIKLVQRSHFQKELDVLSNQLDISRSSSILRLNPFIDETGILRVSGRLKLSCLPYNAKHPALLPGRHPLSRLIITQEHERHFHAGPQATLAAVRQNYWLVSARDVVRQITRKCITCFRSSPKTASTLIGDLPLELESQFLHELSKNVEWITLALSTTKMDRESQLKCCIAIFICFSTTAVHIELLADLSAEAFLNILKRFISRRGYLSDIYSDNGLNFVGAEHELKELATLFNNQEVQQKIINYMAVRKIRWHFIPPRAPHHGGLWEAAVKRTKRHLFRVTKDAQLKYEEMGTLLVQIEVVLNSRPFTPMSPDPADLTPLMPGHFLIGSPLISYPEPSLEDLPINRLSRWQRVEQLRQHFWLRRTREYLHHYQQRNKWKIKEKPVHIGQMVLLKEANTPPLSWPIARIPEIHPGIDDIVCTVTVP